MSKNQKPIGRIENGLFILETKKQKQFFKGKTTSFLREFQEWLDNSVAKLILKYPEGYFVLFIQNRNNEISLTYMIDMERYKTQDGSYFIPANHID